MRHLLKSEILDALKESLRDLESLRMVSAIDPELVLLKHYLQTTIEMVEDENLPITNMDWQPKLL